MSGSQAPALASPDETGIGVVHRDTGTVSSQRHLCVTRRYYTVRSRTERGGHCRITTEYSGSTGTHVPSSVAETSPPADAVAVRVMDKCMEAAGGSTPETNRGKKAAVQGGPRSLKSHAHRFLSKASHSQVPLSDGSEQSLSPNSHTGDRSTQHVLTSLTSGWTS